jgi:hypothetical protein
MGDMADEAEDGHPPLSSALTKSGWADSLRP